MGCGHVLGLGGLPGAGKSTLARELAERLGLALVDRDAIRAAMFPSCQFTSEEKRAASLAVLDAVRVNCSLGLSSLVDGSTLSRSADRAALEKVATAHGFRWVLLWLDCPVELAAARVESDRNHVAADRSGQLVREVAARFDPLPSHVLRVDAAKAPDEVLAAAAKVVDGWRDRS